MSDATIPSESALVATAGLGVVAHDPARAHRERARHARAVAQRLASRLEGDPPRGRIVFITGPSGSGKTTLLEQLRNHSPIARVRDPARLVSRRALIDWIHPDPARSMRCLAAAGLADAHAFLTRVRDLSAGQRARASLARALARVRSRPIVCDEFASGLDALTAEALARCASRAFRAQRRTLIAASARDELIDPLRPDVLVYIPLAGPPEIHDRAHP